MTHRLAECCKVAGVLEFLEGLQVLNADDDGCQVSILCDADPLAAVGSAPEDVGEVGA